MRYVLLSALLYGCSGNGFAGTPETASGGAAQSGGAASNTGGAIIASGGGVGNGGSVRDAAFDAASDAHAPDGGSHPLEPEAAAPLTSCPATPPVTGTACIGSFDCAYGDNPRVACRPVHQCRRGTWLLSTPQCPPKKSCAGDVTPPAATGNACDTEGDLCSWSNGDTCSCVKNAALAWKCAPRPPTPCPMLPANEGQPCTPGAPACTYAFCGALSHVVTSCADGTWTWSFPICG